MATKISSSQARTKKQRIDDTRSAPDAEPLPNVETAGQPHGDADEHFGRRVIVAIQALPADMRNDPSYADPVAWVRKARENTLPFIVDD